MPGRAYAVTTGAALVGQVLALAEKLALEAQEQVKVGRRLWGAVRNIDVVLTQPESRLRLGVECKFQGSTGTAEEKIPAILNDIDAWPIRGIVVISGKGFSPNMRYYLLSSGKAVEVEDLEDWLRLYFGLPLETYSQPRLLVAESAANYSAD
ncbi:MAG TPA: PD-(D/E)XK nuclease superfamily protein [Chloroflexota bacterium]|nr:PD-(D/E)XK nuclease superfamily protein [Chloroflexota bacterium]